MPRPMAMAVFSPERLRRVNQKHDKPWNASTPSFTSRTLLRLVTCDIIYNTPVDRFVFIVYGTLIMATQLHGFAASYPYPSHSATIPTRYLQKPVNRMHVGLKNIESRLSDERKSSDLGTHCIRYYTHILFHNCLPEVNPCYDPKKYKSTTCQ